MLRRATLKGLFLGCIRTSGTMACYRPRHALVYRGRGQTVVVCICFQCFYLVVLEAGTKEGRFVAFGDMDQVVWKGRAYPFMDLLNGLLADAGIPLAK